MLIRCTIITVSRLLQNSAMRTNPLLSKSRLLSFLQCPKKLWLEVRRAELAEPSAEREALFEAGRKVGEVARGLYDGGFGAQVEYSPDLRIPLRATQELVADNSVTPIFEATFEHDDVLIRTDVLERSLTSTRLVEVKGATKFREEYVTDCAIQTWVLDSVGLGPSSVVVAHVDSQFEYRGGGEYHGLLVEADITDLARRTSHQVPNWSRAAHAILAADEPDVLIGQHCRTPYECPFINYCWPRTEYPLTALPRLGKKLDQYVSRAYRDVRDVPEAEISGEEALRVWRATKSGRAEIQRGLRNELRAIPYPRYYLDFETVAFAVPIWPGTRPYQAVPFQWSIHLESAPGALEHFEHLDVSGELPVRDLARRLIRVLGTSGPILTYTDFEARCIRMLAVLVPELADALQALEARLLDIQPIIKRGYYHPAMLGSWSIKAVLPTVVPGMRYEEVGEVQEGMAAQRVYLQAIDPRTTAGRRQEIVRALSRYCSFDTEAMVRMLQHL